VDSVSGFGNGQAAASTQPVPEVVQKALEIFDKVDTNHDGELSKKELKTALQSTWLKSRQAAAAAAVFDMHTEVAGINVSFPEARSRFSPGGMDKKGVTKADLQGFTTLKPAAQPREETERMYAGAVDRVEHINRNLFANGIASIRPEAIRQGTIGDCYFLAALASQAKIDPQVIKDMITPHADGSYTVDFATGPVTVPPLTEADFATFSGSPDGAWVVVMEKAFYKDHPDAEDGALIKGIKQLTGIGGDILPFIFTTGFDRIRNELSSAQKDGRLMVVSRTWTGKKADGVSSGHVVTVIGYDRKTDKVTVRDPGGKTGPNKDGYHTYTMREFFNGYDLLGTQNKLFTDLTRQAAAQNTGKRVGDLGLSALGNAAKIFADRMKTAKTPPPQTRTVTITGTPKGR
jgi:hypothetical protein